MIRPFLFSGVVGCTVIVMSLVLLIIFPQNAPRLPEGFFTPIIAFEFARTASDVIGVLGEPGSMISYETRAAMNQGNHLDYIYMILYSLFLLLFCLRVYWLTGKTRYLLIALLAPTVLAGDVLENVQLLSITKNVYTSQIENELFILRIATWLKWGGLALLFTLLSPFFINQGRPARYIGYGGVFSLVLAVMAFFYQLYLCELFSLSVALMFVSLIVFSFLYKISPESRSATP